MKLGVGMGAYLCFYTTISAVNHRDTMGIMAATKFTSFPNQKKNLSDPGDEMNISGTRSTVECSVKCLNQGVCMSFNVCEENFQDYPVRCELFKKRTVHAKLHPSTCSYFERESPCQNGGEYLDGEDRCKCVDSFAGLTCQRIMRDCSEGYKDRSGSFGQHLIQPVATPKPFRVFCNFYNAGGTTYVMYRYSSLTPRTDFAQSWQVYKEGFGVNNPWIGNEHLHQITSQGVYELHVGIMQRGKPYKYVYYDQISVDNETERYALHLGAYKPGSLGGDSLTPASDPRRNINGKPFSTFDNDVSNNCSATLKAGWWFAEDCTAANLNGPLDFPQTPRVFWLYPLGEAEVVGLLMKIRARSYYSEMP